MNEEKLPIAVLCTSVQYAVNWLQADRGLDIKHVNLSQARVTDVDGQVYMLVRDQQHIRGYHFASYLKSPDYYSLEDELKTRIVNV